MKIHTAVRSMVAALGLCALPAVQAQEVTLRAVSFLRLDVDATHLFRDFLDRVNKEGKGLVQIRYQGGPEVINPFELGNAVRSGVVDFAQLPTAFYAGILPAAMATVLAGKSPVEQRRNGAYEYLNGLHNQTANMQVIASLLWGMPNHIFLAKKTPAIERGDFAGLKLRAVPVYRPFFDALGATSINMNQSDVYTAMERGTVDGYGYVLLGVKEQGWLPVTRFRVDPGFNTTTLMFVVNLDKWKSLTEPQRALLTRLGVEHEQRALDLVQRSNAEELQKHKDGGIQGIELKGEAARKYVQTAKDAGWADVKGKAPQHYEKLRQLLE